MSQLIGVDVESSLNAEGERVPALLSFMAPAATSGSGECGHNMQLQLGCQLPNVCLAALDGSPYFWGWTTT